MTLSAVDIVPSTGESDLRFTNEKFGAGTVVRFGDELVWYTETQNGPSIIEYKGRNAGLTCDDDADIVGDVDEGADDNDDVDEEVDNSDDDDMDEEEDEGEDEEDDDDDDE